MEVVNGLFGAWFAVGMLSTLVSVPLFDQLALEYFREFESPRDPEAKARLLAHVRKALQLKPWSHALKRFWPTFLILTLIVGADLTMSTTLAFTDGLINVAGSLVGLTAGIGSLYWLGLKNRIETFWLEKAKLSARMLARWDAPAEAEALLHNIARSKKPSWRIAAAIGFREMGDAAGLKGLMSLSNDPDTEVADFAKACLVPLQSLLAGTAPSSVKPIHKFSLGEMGSTFIVRNRKTKAQAADKEFIKVTKDHLEAITYSQIHIRKAFPHVYCRACLARGEQLFHYYWDWVRCVKCEDAEHLVADVVEVAGVIGPSEEWVLENGYLQVRLWDEEKRVGRNADIAILEIIGGHNINYDWAVNSVIGHLQNSNPEYGKSIRVKIGGNPELSDNTKRLLRELDPLLINNE